MNDEPIVMIQSPYRRKEFSIENGIEYQNSDLDDWKTILTPTAYNELEMYAKETNDIAKTGYEIRRGSDLTNFIANLKLRQRNNGK